MKNFEKDIDKLVEKVLNETAKERGEIIYEKLHGKQKKLDVAKPKGKLTKDDFLKLQKMKKKETNEVKDPFENDDFSGELEVDFDEFDPRDKSWEEIKAHTGSPEYSELDEAIFFGKDDESTPGDYEGDEEAENKAERLSAKEPLYMGRGLEPGEWDIRSGKTNRVPKMIGSFGEMGRWFDEKDYAFDEDTEFDFDEETFDEFEPFDKKYGGKTKWFDRGEMGKRMFNRYKNKFGPMRVRSIKTDLEEIAGIKKGLKNIGKGIKSAFGYTSSEKDYDKDVEKFDLDSPVSHRPGTSGDHERTMRSMLDFLDTGYDEIEDEKTEMGEEETSEGNAFTGALSKAKKSGQDTFKVGNKTFNVKEARLMEKWKGKVDVEKTSEYEDMSIEELNSAIKKLKVKNEKTKAAGKKVSQADKTKMSQLYFAKRSKQGWKGKGSAKVKEGKNNNLTLTEDELISLIENVVIEQKTKKAKGNIADKTPIGLQITDKVLRQDKKENDNYIKDLAKKMGDYLKTGSKGKYEMNPKHFPKGNGELAKMDKKAYVPDADADEYIEEFSYGGGMENLNYDEIKPNEDWMKKNIEGDSMTGNSQKYGNAVETELGEKINAKRKRNMFSKEKKNSYKRVDQPTSGSEKSKGQKDSDKLFAKLESKTDNKDKLVTEELKKIKKLFNYKDKTQ